MTRRSDKSPKTAAELLVNHTLGSGGRILGPVSQEDQPFWARSLLHQFREASNKTRCPHLMDGDLAMVWMAPAPDLICCPDCQPELVRRIEERLGGKLADIPGRCSACRKPALVRGVSLQAGNILLRGMICSVCEGYERAELDEDELSNSHPLEDLRLLGISPMRIDEPSLREADSLADFDYAMDSILIRGQELTQFLAGSVNRELAQRASGLNLDEAVIGGLLVKMNKLLGGIIDSVRSADSESHSPLSRSLAETSITIRWLIDNDSQDSYRRFRADSFAQWRGWVEESETAEFNDEEQQFREPVDRHIAEEMEAADITWDDVPKRSNSWGPDARQRFEKFGQGWIYQQLFSTHSSYVHPSWHEIRAFHVATDSIGMRLDIECAEMSPPAAFVLAQLVFEATIDAARFLPHDLSFDVFERIIERSVQASQVFVVQFADFTGRGGLKANMGRHRQVT